MEDEGPQILQLSGDVRPAGRGLPPRAGIAAESLRPVSMFWSLHKVNLSQPPSKIALLVQAGPLGDLEMLCSGGVTTCPF